MKKQKVAKREFGYKSKFVRANIATFIAMMKDGISYSGMSKIVAEQTGESISRFVISRVFAQLDIKTMKFNVRRVGRPSLFCCNVGLGDVVPSPNPQAARHQADFFGNKKSVDDKDFSYGANENVVDRVDAGRKSVVNRLSGRNAGSGVGVDKERQDAILKMRALLEEGVSPTGLLNAVMASSGASRDGLKQKQEETKS